MVQHVSSGGGVHHVQGGLGAISPWVIHVAVEVCVVGALSYYFYARLASVEGRFQELHEFINREWDEWQTRYSADREPAAPPLPPPPAATWSSMSPEVREWKDWADTTIRQLTKTCQMMQSQMLKLTAAAAPPQPQDPPVPVPVPVPAPAPAPAPVSASAATARSRAPKKDRAKLSSPLPLPISLPLTAPVTVETFKDNLDGLLDTDPATFESGLDSGSDVDDGKVSVRAPHEKEDHDDDDDEDDDDDDDNDNDADKDDTEDVDEGDAQVLAAEVAALQ